MGPMGQSWPLQNCGNRFPDYSWNPEQKWGSERTDAVSLPTQMAVIKVQAHTREKDYQQDRTADLEAKAAAQKGG